MGVYCNLTSVICICYCFEAESVYRVQRLELAPQRSLSDSETRAKAVIKWYGFLANEAHNILKSNF